MGWLDDGIRNTLITSTCLGESGSFYIHTDSDGVCQGFGGWRLSDDMILQILKTLEVKNWEDLKGKYCRVDSVDGLLKGIGHITKEKWFYPEKHSN